MFSWLELQDVAHLRLISKPIAHLHIFSQGELQELNELHVFPWDEQ